MKSYVYDLPYILELRQENDCSDYYEDECSPQTAIVHLSHERKQEIKDIMKMVRLNGFAYVCVRESPINSPQGAFFVLDNDKFDIERGEYDGKSIPDYVKESGQVTGLVDNYDITFTSYYTSDVECIITGRCVYWRVVDDAGCVFGSDNITERNLS
jgi:hypothetical protein